MSDFNFNEALAESVKKAAAEGFKIEKPVLEQKLPEYSSVDGDNNDVSSAHLGFDEMIIKIDTDLESARQKLAAQIANEPWNRGLIAVRDQVTSSQSQLRKLTKKLMDFAILG